jgi:hypothetical protein
MKSQGETPLLVPELHCFCNCAINVTTRIAELTQPTTCGMGLFLQRTYSGACGSVCVLHPIRNMVSTEQGQGPVSRLEEPSLKDLIGVALDDARDLLRAEIDIAKADATQVLKLTAFALVVVTAGSVLLALAISLLLAALVLALQGTPVQALLSAAAGNCVICGAGLAWLMQQLRKSKSSSSSTAADTHLVNRSARQRQPS